MATPQVKTGLFVGLNKGHVVTRRELAPRPNCRKGKTSKRTLFIRSLIREVAGFAPFGNILQMSEVRPNVTVGPEALETHVNSPKVSIGKS